MKSTPAWITNQRNFFRAPELILAFVLSSILIGIGVKALSFNDEHLTYLLSGPLAVALLHTFILLVLVSFFTLLLGVPLGWIQARTTYPGKKVLDILLVLPLAFPPYVCAFLWKSLSDYSGFIHQEFGLSFFSLPPILLLALALSSCLYPYVFVLARSAFASQSNSILCAGQTLGVTALQSFRKIELPLSLPFLFSGALLVGFETLSDFGAVSVFNVDTLSVLIYQSWFDFFSLPTASLISCILGLALCMLIVTKKRVDLRFLSQEGETPRPRRASFLPLFPVLVFTTCFLVPFLTLAQYSLSSDRLLSEFLPVVMSTVGYGAIAALLAVCIACIASASARFYQESRFSRLSLVGYALPGTILAVGLINVFGKTMLAFSAAALLLGYLIRFFPLSRLSLFATYSRLERNQDHAATLLGARPFRIFSRIHLPQLRLGIFAAFLLVFIEVSKEMPLTLMARPTGMESLSIKIFEYTSEGRWFAASIPSLLLVLLGMLSVLFMQNVLLKEGTLGNPHA